MAIFNIDYVNELLNEGLIGKIKQKAGKKKKSKPTDEFTFSREQYKSYSKTIHDVSKKFDHVGKLLSILSYDNIVALDHHSYDTKYLVALFDTEDYATDKLEKEVESFAKELNSSIDNVKFEHDFNGYRFELYMLVYNAD